MNTRTRGSWKSRAAVLAGAFGCALALSTTVAWADGIWTLQGSSRITRAEAQSDLPGLSAKCRRQGGLVTDSGIKTRSFDSSAGGGSGTDPDSPYRAYVACRQLR